MSVALTTDLYELTMAASYLSRGMTQSATFSLFVRDLPRDRGFLVAAGLDSVLTVLEEFAFDAADLSWLAGQGFDAAAVDAFAALRFTGDVWAIPEGRVVLPNEPLLEVTAPLPEAQLVESILLNQITFQTVLATKATRCSLAARGRASLVDFSLRRTHGIEASMAAARAAAIAGFAGTSNVEAARRLGVPAVGTMAHSYVEAFPTEREAFIAMATDFPDRTAFLVDTYDTITGVEIAIDVAEALGRSDRLAVRIDSGDLLELSRRTREKLDAAGRQDATIIVSGGLDEFDVERLLDEGAPINAFGVGTRIGVSADAPSLETVYKLVEYAGEPTMKLSEGKQSMPGAKQVFRSAVGIDDVLAERSETAPAGTSPVLIEVMRGGERTRPPERIAMAADRLDADLAQLPETARLLRDPTVPSVRVSDQLQRLTQQVADAHRKLNDAR
ncbi:MAG TPA: nicotinate phosphoribosyltransferase [Ilumatobacteraceae bacterium]|nr:nicotinate phosphoribosyltransferase [Ilumatobacteraceae bacterium]